MLSWDRISPQRACAPFPLLTSILWAPALHALCGRLLSLPCPGVLLASLRLPPPPETSRTSPRFRHNAH